MKQNRKAAIIGAGFVGSTIAYSMMLCGAANEIVLIDIDKEKAQAEADDIIHGVRGVGNAAVYAGGFEECADCDLLIVTAGRGRKPGESRRDLTRENLRIIEGVLESVKPYDNGCPVMIISNPVDILTAKVSELLHSENGRVFSTGCMLDSSRFVRCIAKTIFPDRREEQSRCAEIIHAEIVGEHGELQIPVWSGVTVYDTPISDYCQEHQIPWNEAIKEQIAQATKKMGAAIIQGKGRTNYGIAACACRLARAVLDDCPMTASVSSVLPQTAGGCPVALSVPSVVGAAGVLEQKQTHWNPQEQQAFENSILTMQKLMKEI